MVAGESNERAPPGRRQGTATELVTTASPAAHASNGMRRSVPKRRSVRPSANVVGGQYRYIHRTVTAAAVRWQLLLGSQRCPTTQFGAAWKA